MLTVENFKKRLERPNHPDWLLVAVDSKNKNQLSLLSNAGMGNIHCAPIEWYLEEIKICAREMITQGELFIKKNEGSIRVGNGRSVYVYTLKPNSNTLEADLANQKVYFSSTFIRWQRSYNLSDEVAQEKLGLTADEFHQFREDELTISEDLLTKLADVTGISLQIWKNKKAHKMKWFNGDNENI
jgi:hypothetical protein